MPAAPAADATFAKICKVATAPSDVVSSWRADYQIPALVLGMGQQLTCNARILCHVKASLGRKKTMCINWYLLSNLFFCTQMAKFLRCRLDQPGYCDHEQKAEWTEAQDPLMRRFCFVSKADIQLRFLN